MLAIHVAVVALGLIGDAPPQPSIAVYRSEANAAEYHGVHQQPLRDWLTARGEAFKVIGDADASDPGALGSYSVVVATSTYVVPDPARQGLMEYVRRGGALMWIDSPAKCGAEFLAFLGLGPTVTYGALEHAKLTAAPGAHPALPAPPTGDARDVVGNPATSATPNAQVLLDMEGDLGGKHVSFPGVTYVRQGAGMCLVYNWIIWLTRDPDAPDLLADGLNYVSALRLLSHPGERLLRAVVPASARQPEPIAVRLRIYERPANGGREGEPPAMELRLVNSSGLVVSGPILPLTSWTAAADDLRVGVGDARVPTAGLADGTYVVAVRAQGPEATAGGCRGTVTLDGERRTRMEHEQQARRRALEPLLAGTLGDYDAEPRTPDGRVDIPRLLEQIATAHMNTYDWLIWHAPTDWEDLQRFVPEAARHGVRVWVTLCPPSEQGNGMTYSEPYRLDFLRWADGIGDLSKRYPNLVALVIDDFCSGGNDTLFTPSYIADLAARLRARNPHLAFLPTLYWSNIGDEQWLRDYGPAIDGIVFPYSDLVSTESLASQLRACRKWLGPTKFVLINVYASGSDGRAEPGPRSPDYMRSILSISRQECDGIRIYCLPKDKMLDDYRYAITAELYGKWAREQH